MTRFFDIIFSLIGLIILSPIIIIITIICFFDTGSPFFQQKRVGINKKPFQLIKFRTMYINTESIATHLIGVNSITNFGKILRKSKLDEVPQLLNVIIGEMSLVGPRPNLFNQYDLIKLREEKGIYKVLPGITGLAQIKKIDMSSPEILTSMDEKMLVNFNIIKYFYYIFMTLLGSGFGDRIKYMK